MFQSPLKQFGQFLRDHRDNRHATLADIRDDLELESAQTVGNWERGTILPTKKRLDQIPKAYKLSEDEAKEAIRLWQAAKAYKERRSEVSAELGYGEDPIIRRMTEFAKESKKDPFHQYFIHSISSHGYLSSRSHRISEAVLRIAQAGIYIVYFSLPGTKNSNQVQSQLDAEFDDRFRDLEATESTPVDPELIRNRILLAYLKYDPLTMGGGLSRTSTDKWASTFETTHIGAAKPKGREAIADLIRCVGTSANLFGNFLRYMVFSKIPINRDYDSTLKASHFADPDLQVEEIWLNLAVDDGGDAGPYWLPIQDSNGSLTRDYRKNLKELIDHDLLQLKPLLGQKE